MAVAGMAAAAPVPSAFLPGATKRSHHLGSWPVPAVPEPREAPRPPPHQDMAPGHRMGTSHQDMAPGCGTGISHQDIAPGHRTRASPCARLGLETPRPPSPPPQGFTARNYRVPFVRLRRHHHPTPLTPQPPRGLQHRQTQPSSGTPAGRARGAGVPQGEGVPVHGVFGLPLSPHVGQHMAGRGQAMRVVGARRVRVALGWPCVAPGWPRVAQTVDFPQGERLNRGFQGFRI